MHRGILICFTISFLSAQNLLLNESMSRNISSVYDEDSTTHDWVELYNSGTEALNLVDFFLSDDLDSLNKWQFPEGTLDPGSHLLVFASNKDRKIWPQGSWVPIINFGTSWNYLAGPTEISSNWNTIDFDDSGWPNGPSSIGYGDDDDITIIDPVVSLYLRKTFQVENVNEIAHGLLHMDYDDGFVAYLNGMEVVRENMGEPGTEVLPSDFAMTNVEANIYRGLKPEKFFVENVAEYLVDGQNILSIQVHNANENLADLTALPILSFYYTNPPLPSETSEVTIRIQTDSYPDETSWTLIGVNGTQFYETVPPGSMTLSNSLYEWTLDVPTGDYGITINDTWGDGLCCEDGVSVPVYNSGFESDGGWSVWPLDVSSENWNQAHGEGESSYNALEVYGTSSTGAVAFWQEVPVYPGELHHLSVYAKHNSENPMQNGQSAHAILEFWGGGWWGQYLISSHVTEYVTMSSAQDEWIELSTAAVAPDDAINTHVVVVFSNPTGNQNGSVFFDNMAYRRNVHNENASLYNGGEFTVMVDGSTIIQGGEFEEYQSESFNTVNLLSDLLNYQNPYLHTNFRIGSDGETIYLSNQNSDVIDSMSIPPLSSNVSYGYQTDGVGELTLFNDPTPEYSNSLSSGYYDYTSNPTFSDSGGFKDDYFNLYISSQTDDAVIYYTTDGSKPDENSNIYQNFISIDNNLLTNGTQTPDQYGIIYSPTYDGIIIRAIAIAPNHIPSEIVTHSYIFDPVNSDLPVVSIAIAPDDLWDPETGMHVPGNAFWPWYPYYGSNFWNDWEKEVHIEFYEPGGIIGFKQDLGMKIFGGWSRAEAQKSFSFFARGMYGDGDIDYELFPESGVDSYETFILRAHGQDNVMFRDGFQTSLASENDVVVQDYRPAVVYLNGEFWGIQNIREKVNEHFINTHFGIDSDELDMLAIQAGSPEPELIHGSTEDYTEFRQFLTNNDLGVDANYQYAAQKYDVENLIDYKIAQIFVMNYDWPGNNNKLFKSKSGDGKWRHIMYDSDFGFERWTDLALGFIGSYETYNMLDHAIGEGNVFNNPVWSTAVLTTFLDNMDFRNKFINTYCDRLNTTYSTENTLYFMDSLRTIIEPYISDHISRYGPDIYDSYTPNTFGQYNSAYQRMQNFANYRPDNARNEMVEIFGLSGSSNTISLYMNDVEAGYVEINSLEIGEQGWSGEYFSDVPITVKAVPNFGYEFSHWSEPSYDDSVTLYLDQDMSLVANFMDVQNPYQDMISINEINYNSSDDFDPGDWVELYNFSDQSLNISGWKFMDSDDSHVFTFPEGSILEASSYLVLCQDSTEFSQAHPEVQNYIGSLDFGFSGSGELLRLLDNYEDLVDFVNYEDNEPWPTEPDGSGKTLELVNPQLDNSLAESWASSNVQYGTPGYVNSAYSSLSSDTDVLLPAEFAMYQNYPNPFNPITSIKYDLPKDAHTVMEVFDIMGKHVKTLIDENQTAGFKTVKWDATNSNGNNVAAGMYIYQIKSGSYNETKKMILLK